MNKKPNKFYQKRKKAGLCVSCGKPLDREGVRCIACNNKMNEDNREYRKLCRSIGICPRCRKNKLYGDEKVCLECGAYEYTIYQKKKERVGQKTLTDAHVKWEKEAIQKWDKQGLCHRCGKRKADIGHVTCSKCRNRDNTTKQIRVGKKPSRSERYLQGLCYFCDEPIEPGYKVCSFHRQRNKEIANSENCKKARKELLKKGILY